MNTLKLLTKRTLFLCLGLLIALPGFGQGAELVKDISPGPDYSDPHNFIVHNGLLYFKAFHSIMVVHFGLRTAPRMELKCLEMRI